MAVTYNVVGIEQVDYTNKAGKHIVGNRFHLLGSPNSDKRVSGAPVLSEFVSGESDLVVGDEVRLYYNKWGRVDEIVRSHGDF